MASLSDLQIEIDSLAAKLIAQLATHKPIDFKRLDQLQEMRRNRDYSLAAEEQRRRGEMQNETRQWKAKILAITKINLKLHAAFMEQIEDMQDAYDVLAERWVKDEVCPWIDSEAAAIAAGILILFNEIR